MPSTSPATKTCTKCGATKPLSDFHRDRTKPDGHRARCKACFLAAQAARRRRLATSGPTIARNEKWCPSCRRTLPADAFHSDRTSPDGLASRCKACSLAAQAARRADPEVRERVRAYNRAYSHRWARENPDAKRAQSARRRARKAAATVEDFSAADLATSWDERGLYACVYCGGPAEHADHVVPLSRGGAHVVGNLVPACAECNISKSARTLPEWRRDLWTAALAAARRTRSREATSALAAA